MIKEEQYESERIYVEIGNKIREKRAILGMSQDDLAKRIGVTFQQVQKYEKGQNRMSVSRLLSILRTLDLDQSTFFNDLKKINFSSNDNLSLSEEQTPYTPNTDFTKEALIMAKCFASITNSKTRKKLLSLVRTVASI